MIIKSELIAEMSKKITQLSEKNISHGVGHIIEKIAAALAKKERIEIRGFGAFSSYLRPSRLAHNPKTGQKLNTAPKHAVRFKAGKELREKINAHYGNPIYSEESKN